ncbi:MAG: alpha/beta hydrolase [Pseudomonadota bacterium]
MLDVKVSDWDDAYANAPYIDDGERFPEDWERKAAAFRASRGERARIDVSYGAGEREAFDLFLPESGSNGLMMFIHGGYWRAFDKSSWSHLAAGACEMGYAVAIPSYTLAPSASLIDIFGQVTRATQQAAGLVGGPVYLCGHSAGGHLVSRMVCANSPLSRGVADRVQRVLSISGVHDLRPLLRTQINRDLRLDFESATRESPALLYPREGVEHVAWVGAEERPEFRRQSALIANIWSGCGAATGLHVEPGRHHYDVIEGLETPGSAMLKALFRGR